MAKPYSEIYPITLDTTGVSYSPVFEFDKFQDARQLEIKANVSAGDGSCIFSVETSDDGVERFEVDNSSFTIAGIDKAGILIDSQGNYIRVKMDYTHDTDDTVMDLFILVR